MLTPADIIYAALLVAATIALHIDGSRALARTGAALFANWLILCVAGFGYGIYGSPALLIPLDMATAFLVLTPKPVHLARAIVGGLFIVQLALHCSIAIYSVTAGHSVEPDWYTNSLDRLADGQVLTLITGGFIAHLRKSGWHYRDLRHRRRNTVAAHKNRMDGGAK